MIFGRAMVLFSGKLSFGRARAHQTVFDELNLLQLRLLRLVELHQDLPSLWIHESVRRRLPVPGHSAHLRTGDGYEVILPRRIKEGHLSNRLVVRREMKWKQLELLRKHWVELQH